MHFRWLLQEDYNKLVETNKLMENTLYFPIQHKARMDESYFIREFHKHPDIEVKIGIMTALVRYFNYNPNNQMFKEIRKGKRK